MQRITAAIWYQYVYEMRTIKQLATLHGRSDEWVRTKLQQHPVTMPRQRPRRVVIVMDVTYFGPWGVLVVIDPNARTERGENLVLYYAFLEGSERTVHYQTALDTLEAMGYTITGATIDGRRGVRELLARQGIPAQYCQFHQLQTITRCLTRRPYLLQNRQLRSIALSIPTTNEADLTAALDGWYAAYSDWLRQRDHEGRFMHPRTRRAYFSLRRNLPYLFMYQRATHVSIPNTTNALDGRFGVWKSMLHRHRGCSRRLKIKILRSLFAEAQR